MAPPSVVRSATAVLSGDSPPASQMDTAGHETLRRSATPAGVGRFVQVLPASVVAHDALPKPTAMQLLTEGQLTLSSSGVPAGRRWRNQVVPPLVVRSIPPRVPRSVTVPTAAAQIRAVGQATPLADPPGTTCAVHRLPPSVVLAMAAVGREARFPSYPEATHTEAVGHARPSTVMRSGTDCELHVFPQSDVPYISGSTPVPPTSQVLRGWQAMARNDSPPSSTGSLTHTAPPSRVL